SEKKENSTVPAPPGCADDATTSGASSTSTPVTTTGVYFHENGCQYKVVKWYGKMITVDCMAECGPHEVQLELGTPCAEV
ncbi:hypothetical protein MTO96_032971, partial [Rhipicephalus appendiculatus]